MSSPRPSPGPGCRELWREGGRRSPGSPAHPTPTPPRPGGWEARSVPGARAWPRRVLGCAPGAGGLEGLPPGTRIRGALWTPRARGPRAPRRPWPGRASVRWDPAWVIWKPQWEPGACAHPRAGWGDACPLQFCRPRPGESQLLAPGASLGTRLDLGPSPHFSGELVKAVVSGWASLPTRVLSIVCHVFISD